MSPRPARSRPIDVPLLILALACLAGSLWALRPTAECATCQAAAARVAGINIAAFGVAYYSLIILSAALIGRGRLTDYLFSIAGGVHIGLLTILLTRHQWCITCVITGALAIIGMTIAILRGFGRSASPRQ